VTIADLSAQALIALHIQDTFPEDSIIGEEDTTELRRDNALLNRVVGLVNEGFGEGSSRSSEESVSQTS
jgi:3'(2'), 5'-bisphosphate nucleotidase